MSIGCSKKRVNVTRHRFAGMLLLGLGLCSLVFGQSRPLIEVESMVDTSVITIGDRITYSIVIDRRADLRIEKPGEGLNLGMFEIKDYDFREPQKKDGRIIERYDYSISVFDTGKFTIPPFPIAYFPNDTSRAFRVIEAPAIDIYVRSVLSGEDARELKDIKPPLEVPFNYFFWGSMLAILILLIAIGILGYYLWKKRRDKGYLFIPPPPPRPAHEIALEALEKLYRTDLLEQKAFKAFFTELAFIIRRYLEGRYFIRALEETTPEIMRDVRAYLTEPELRSGLENLLSLADLIKFAKYIPGAQEIEAVKSQAVDLIQRTKLDYEPVAEGEAAEAAAAPPAIPAESDKLYESNDK